MTRAEEKSIAYQLATHGPNVMGGASVLSEDEYIRLNMNYDFKAGYEEAEKDLADVAAFSSGPDGFYYGKGYQQGKKDAEKHLGWHSVEESLPPVDEDVIVLTDEVNDTLLPDACLVCVAHIVDPDLTVDVDRISYRPISYNGWNIPGVKFWMPMPKIPKEDE